MIPIQKELTDGKDELAQWAKDRSGINWFLPVDDESTQQSFREIVNLVAGQSFTQRVKDIFMDRADPWLIAKDIQLDAAVITHEKYDPKCERKILIPNVCKAFNVNYMDVYDLINTLGASFGLR